jgi:hypothetical protein
MDGILLAQHLLSSIDERRERIAKMMMNGTLKDIEEYRQLVGNIESVATVCGYVLKAGPLAYKDTEKFPEGPWCNEKDWVIFGRYAGARFKIDGGEVRVLNDDEVIAVIQEPEDILHF